MSQKLIPASLLVSLLLLFLAWAAFHHREHRLFPLTKGKELRVYTYTDIADSGTSLSTSTVTADQVTFSYVLGTGFHYPYVGLGFELLTRDTMGDVTSYLNIEGYDSLRIRVRSTGSSEMRVQFLTNDSALSRPGAPLSQRYLVQNTSLERGWTVKSLWMGDFTIPEWWFRLNNLNPDPGNRFLNRAARFEIQNSSRMPVGVRDTLEISELTLVGENRSLGYVLAGVAAFLLAAFAMLSWLERERMRSDRAAQIAARREDLLLKAEKLPLSSHRTEDAKRILEFIGKNYSDSELDLERVCRETGVNRNRLSAILKEEVGTTFKGHLTDLRLSEATRALAETDLQVTEIAYKVGFGNVSHFNRVFKEHFEIAPVEYRKSKKKADKNPEKDS